MEGFNKGEPYKTANGTIRNSKQQGTNNVIENMNQMLPTPSTRDYKGANGENHFKEGERSHMGQLPNFLEIPNGKKTGLKLQPAFALWMMGAPEDWTLLPFQKVNGEQNL